MSPRAVAPGPATRLTWDQVRAWRAERHHLERRAHTGGMLAVAARICGLPAQLMSSAELPMWQAGFRRCSWSGAAERVWSQQARGRRLGVHIEPFRELRPRIRRVVEDEAERLAAFAGANLALTWG